MLSQWDKQRTAASEKEDGQSKRQPESESNRRLTTARLKHFSSTQITQTNRRRRKKINEKKERGRDRETSFRQTTTSPKKAIYVILECSECFCFP